MPTSFTWIQLLHSNSYVSLVCSDLDHHNNKNYVSISMQRVFLGCGKGTVQLKLRCLNVQQG